MDSGLDSWTGLWTEIWTQFWTDAQGNDDHFQQLRVKFTINCNVALEADTGRMGYECTKELLVFIKHVEVYYIELIISLGKLVKGASPQGIGHQVETPMQ